MSTELQLASAFASFLGGPGTYSEPVSVVAVDPGGEMDWDPDPQPELQTVMPDYGPDMPDYGRPYLPAKDPYSSGTFLTGGSAGMAADEVTLTGGQLMSGSAGFPVWEQQSFEAGAEPTWWERGGEILLDPKVKPMRDFLINKYLLKPDTETVNTAGGTETNINPQDTPPRGSTPISSIPQQTVFFPWQQPGDIGDDPQAGPGLGVSTGVLLIGGLALFLLTR